MKLRPGDTVFHVWSNPFISDAPPLGILSSLGIELPGILLGLEDDHPFVESMIPYWSVLVDGDVKQWREDMIALAS